jgi:hypothetical protein
MKFFELPQPFPPILRDCDLNAPWRKDMLDLVEDQRRVVIDEEQACHG